MNPRSGAARSPSPPAVARTIRSARVEGGLVTNARAISSVVRPHTSRSVNATCASGARAGWQQVKSIEEAVEWVRRCPDPMPGEVSEIEIRPFYEAEDFTPEVQAQEKRLRDKIARR